MMLELRLSVWLRFLHRSRSMDTREPILTVQDASNLPIGAADRRQRDGKGKSDTSASQK